MLKNNVPFSRMTPGEAYNQNALLLDMEDNVARNGSDFVRCTLSDGKETIRAYLFDTKSDTLHSMGIDCKNMVSIRLRLNEKNSYYKIYSIENYGGDLIPEISEDPEELFNGIISSISKAAFPVDSGFHTLSELAISILKDNKDLFIYTAAGKSIHHNLIGGLVQHSARVVKLADCACNTYPSLDRELLIVGAALHDIGKVLELKTSSTGITSYTTAGSLLGHSQLGIMMIYNKNIEIPCDPERLILLAHMIAAHHGSKKNGAIVEPLTAEAMVLHKIDSLDCQQNQFEQAQSGIIPGKVSSAKFGPAIRFIYRPSLSSDQEATMQSLDMSCNNPEIYNDYESKGNRYIP